MNRIRRGLSPGLRCERSPHVQSCSRSSRDSRKDRGKERWLKVASEALAPYLSGGEKADRRRVATHGGGSDAIDKLAVTRRAAVTLSYRNVIDAAVVPSVLRLPSRLVPIAPTSSDGTTSFPIYSEQLPSTWALRGPVSPALGSAPGTARA